MFDSLGDRLTGVFDRLTGRGVLSAADVDEALREVRLALLDADVALPVVKDFVGRMRSEAQGEAVIRAVKPSEQVLKIVHDGLVDMLGGDEPTGLELAVVPPSVILMSGLQGSGKTTTSAKLAVRLSKTERKRVLMASLDTRRPAAMEQLATLGRQAEVDVLPIVAGQSAPDIARRALQAGRLGGYDVLILDTAGRTTLDEAMMAEAAEIARIASPHRDPARRRRPHGPGRGQDGQGLPRAPAAHRSRAHPHRRRQPGRCGALHAPRHRPADQVPGRGREDRRA